MAPRVPRYTKEDASRLGDEIYNRDIRKHVESAHNGMYIAIDIETGAWEMDADEILAGDRLRARVPDAQTWMTRAGYGYIRRFGAGRGRRQA